MAMALFRCVQPHHNVSGAVALPPSRSSVRTSFQTSLVMTRKQARVVCEVSRMADAELVTADRLSSLPASQGVYAIFDSHGALQYVGMSRRLSASVQSHFRELPELCGSVKVAAMDAVNREELREAWEVWIREHIESAKAVPPGNAPGNKTWSSRMKRAKQDLKLKPSKETQLTIALDELIAKVVKEFKVVAFIKGSRTAPQCGFSHRVLSILNEQGVDYETIDVLDEEHNSGVREAIKAFSQWPTIPQVFVGGEFVGGADVLTEMAETGELTKLLAT